MTVLEERGDEEEAVDEVDMVAVSTLALFIWRPSRKGSCCRCSWGWCLRRALITAETGEFPANALLIAAVPAGVRAPFCCCWAARLNRLVVGGCRPPLFTGVPELDWVFVAEVEIGRASCRERVSQLV